MQASDCKKLLLEARVTPAGKVLPLLQVVAEALTPARFRVLKQAGGLWLIECQGCGHSRP